MIKKIINKTLCLIGIHHVHDVLYEWHLPHVKISLEVPTCCRCTYQSNSESVQAQINTIFTGVKPVITYGKVSAILP